MMPLLEWRHLATTDQGIFLRKVLFIFGQLSDSDVEWLSTAGDRVRFKAGSPLIEIGKPVNDLYIVLEGQLVVKTASGEKIALLEGGEIVGEMSLVDPAPPTASVDVSVDATLLRVPDAVLRKKLATDVGFASRFYYAICIFLADRMRKRNQPVRLGDAEPSLDLDAGDELNENVLDNLHLAGARFDRMLRRLAG